MSFPPQCSISTVRYGGPVSKILADTYADPGDRRLELMRQINFPDDTSRLLMPGTPLIVPHGTDFNAQQMLSCRAASRQMKANPLPMSPERAAFHDREFPLLTVGTQEISDAANLGGAAADVLTHTAKQIGDDLKALDQAYKTARAARIPLNSAQFEAIRTPIERTIQGRLNVIHSSRILADGHRDVSEAALGISRRQASAAIRWNGSDAQIKGIVGTTAKTTKYATKMSVVGKGFTALSVGMIGIETYTAYKQDGTKAAVRTGLGKTAGFAAGAVASKIAVGLIFGAATGGIGFVVIGVAAVVGAGMAADYGATKLTEATFDQVDMLITK